ncbi:serine/threonine protein kinase [Myxococcus qinghaiensis]|uniref:serine/threonine protein kinase n=1 Tax=Myxococcus qinghaiensis TaxID=2906758 RepID=UPI0020A78F94|nr:protein kinase [Myxococcus qinghaiensis]MCP3163346.1 protein kinase [Myxococcus qinghaiensis]
MSDDSNPRLTEGVVLFSQGDTTYFLFQILGEGRNGERILYARPRTPEGFQGKVLVKYVALSGGEGLTDKHQRARVRLEEEVRLARFLQHPNIARVHGLFEMKNALCVASECVGGFTLDSLLAIAQARGRYFSEAFILYVFAEVAAALAYAHARTDDAGIPLNIVNRDVNPTRIRLTPRGGVKLTDFGVAFSRLAGRVATTLPRPKGDVIYASPELLLGEDVDGRADLFSLGLTMLEFATGRHLYDPGNMKMADLEARMSEEERRRLLKATVRSMDAGLTSLAEDAIHWSMAYRPGDVDAAMQGLPDRLSTILGWLLQRSPATRFGTASELERVLRVRLAELPPFGPKDAVKEVEQALTDAGDAMEELDLLDDEGGFVPADWRAPPDHVETQPEARNEDELTTDPTPAPRRAVKAPPTA